LAVIRAEVHCHPIVMQDSVKERIAKLRDEIAQISEANRLYLHGSKQEDSGRGRGSRASASTVAGILDELVALTDWKKL
jgi:hypothetical protein